MKMVFLMLALMFLLLLPVLIRGIWRRRLVRRKLVWRVLDAETVQRERRRLREIKQDLPPGDTYWRPANNDYRHLLAVEFGADVLVMKISDEGEDLWEVFHLCARRHLRTVKR
ncbi:MAG: hypothetical protein UY92_C0001G0013 [Candidatus Magasanikbacteria bacterium GW2011_GWA2_56_11]|uniref:Uncharacterized protein n=1 Tax=Candidatus Magasanikbacteria bacterium GW2011_GWA2_56_11 TaxID=1619044 RepID=A0A0G2BBQ2_9BACT|nr:MAG: hypothetical protein UY92_C0001G0013 [Candidatus Magasanikbacteria bacterium GW2011_GWA2_56_11]